MWGGVELTNRKDYVPQIPYGTRDFLPQQAHGKRLLEGQLARLFTVWGYEEVVTPTMEYYETLTTGAGGELSENAFKFFDRNNQILALRSDMTTPIARVAAARLQESPMPLRLFYLANVFRQEQAQTGRQCEFYQAGVELMGARQPAADAEVIALAVTGLQQAGLQNFQIGLGQVDFINGVMAEFDLTAKERLLVKKAMLKRDLVGLDTLIARSGLSQAAGEILRKIPLMSGKEEILDQGYKMVKNQTARGALENLDYIYQQLKHYELNENVNFDLGIIRDFDYYTGMVFEGYTPGLGFPLCGGGRYDNMASDFGVNLPATGFALGIERVMLARERQGMAMPTAAKDFYIAWAENKMDQAISEAGKLRRAGRTVELAMASATQSQAQEQQETKGYAALRYFG
ncbi:ATP phosphoribosyltransferase regulatory subunit [Acetonema longum]